MLRNSPVTTPAAEPSRTLKDTPDDASSAASSAIPAPPDPSAPASSGDTSGPVGGARVRSRLKTALFGKARDLHDQRIFHTISLIPFLAWVGLGADGLSSSA